MKPLNTQINLKVVNNTALPQPVSILGVVANSDSANNSNLLYEFDFTGQSFIGITSLNISISNTSNPTVVVNSAQVLTQSIQGVVDALNTLNQGIFSYYGNIIYVSSSYYIYGALQINSNIFTSVWNTNNTSGGSSSANQIQLPLESTGNYNFVVDWGDGSQDTITLWNQAETLHTYSIAGTYTINITGTIQGFNFNGNGDKDKLISISNWGILNLGNSTNYFNGCSNLDLSIVDDVLDLTGTTDLTGMFADCTSLTTINNINQWDVSNVTVMDSLFQNALLFNDDISAWDVSSVVGMSSMFQDASAFNQSLNSWDVSSVTQMGAMFLNASAFNQDISTWNVSSVTNMSGMFASATAFNQDISTWNVSSVTNMLSIFSFASAFNQPLNSWNVSSVINMQQMFRSATAFNQNIGSWNISNVTNFTNFMLSKTNLNYSSANLDAIYNGWSLLSVQPSIIINFGTIKYTLAGQSGRNILTGSPNNWSITDGGI